MGETVDAITYKTDVKSRTRDKEADTKDKITGRATELKERVTGTVSGVGERVSDRVSGGSDTGSGGASSATDRISAATPDAEQVKYKARRAAGVAQENPLGLAVGSVAVGFLVG